MFLCFLRNSNLKLKGLTFALTPQCAMNPLPGICRCHAEGLIHVDVLIGSCFYQLLVCVHLL